jgi:hypothetical protein
MNAPCLFRSRPRNRDDPRGGVRWVLPDKAAYWNKH